MGIGVSLFLIAVGAILAFAVNTAVDGLELDTIGWILMAVGAVGLVLSMIFWSTWGGWGSRTVTQPTGSTAEPTTTASRRETVVEHRDVV